MTKLERPVPRGVDSRSCRWCREPLHRHAGPGRPREFCSQRCRQWDWVARQRSAELDLDADEVVIRRSELDRLNDHLYMLRCAIDDTERDLEVSGPLSNRELRDALGWIMTNARPVAATGLSAA